MARQDMKRLREQAKQSLSKIASVPDDLAATDNRQLIHELRIYQTELELQNDELRKNQEEIERSRRAFQELWDHSPVGLLLLDSKNRITKVNTTGRMLFGRAEADLLGRRFEDLVHRDDQPKVHLLLEIVNNARLPRENEIRVVSPDDSVVVCQMQAKALSGGGAEASAQVVLTDIGEIKRMEEDLRQSEQTARALLNTPPDSMFFIRANGELLLINGQGARRLGGTPESLVGCNVYALVPPEIGRERKKQVQKAINLRRPVVFDDEREGMILHHSIYPVVDEDGIVRTLAVFAQDVTEQKRVEERLRISEERLRLAVEEREIGIWDRDLETGKLIWNEQVFRLLGRDPEGPAVTGETFFEYIHKDDLPRVRTRVEEVYRAGGGFVDEFRIIREDGETRWLAAYGNTISDGAGRPVRMVGIVYDITKRKRAEEKLRDSGERLLLAVKAGKMGVWERNPGTGEAAWDRRTFELYGRDPGRPAPPTEEFNEYIHKDDLPRVRAGLEKALRCGSLFEEEFRIVREDGEMRWIASFGTPVSAGQGKPERMTGINFDITERKQAQGILRKSRDDLELRVKERTAELEQRHREQQRMNRQLGVEVERRRRFEKVLRTQGEKLTQAYKQRAFLAKKLVHLLESERRQIGSTLHDEIGQILTGASLHLEGLIRGRDRGDADPPTRQLEAVQGLIRNAIRRTKLLSSNLRSDALERFGLIPAVKELVEEMKGHFDKGIHLFMKNIPERFGDDNCELVIYRLIQEGLTNVVKHARATDVFININGRDKVILLSVEDNGVGFDYGKLYNTPGQDSLGLIIMRERVAQVGGKFYVESRPGWGTQIFAEIPV